MVSKSLKPPEVESSDGLARRSDSGRKVSLHNLPLTVTTNSGHQRCDDGCKMPELRKPDTSERGLLVQGWDVLKVWKTRSLGKRMSKWKCTPVTTRQPEGQRQRNRQRLGQEQQRKRQKENCRNMPVLRHLRTQESRVFTQTCDMLEWWKSWTLESCVPKHEHSRG